MGIDDKFRPEDVLDELRAIVEKIGSSWSLPMVRASYGFPDATLDPGIEHTIRIDVGGLFRPERLVMAAVMDEVRGHYKIRHTRRGLLNRDDVLTAFSTIKRRASKGRRSIPGRTIVVYQAEARSYLPKNVVYIPTDALEYIQVTQLYCDTQPAIVPGANIDGRIFSTRAFGNYLPICRALPAAGAGISITLKNVGDVQVRVRSLMMGYQRMKPHQIGVREGRKI